MRAYRLVRSYFHKEVSARRATLTEPHMKRELAASVTGKRRTSPAVHSDIDMQPTSDHTSGLWQGSKSGVLERTR
jgi:hypothetical protein